MTIASEKGVALRERPFILAEPESFVALMYHSIAADGQLFDDLSPAATSYFVDRSSFAAQLATLAALDGHCLTWPALDAFYRPDSSEKIPPPADDAATARPYWPVLLTFDDGWAGCAQHGGELLQQHRCRAMIFITTGFLGRPHFLSSSDVSRLDPDVFRIGSHGRTHGMFSLMTDSQVRAELADSRKLLEDVVGYEIDSLSVPNGAVDQRVRRIAAECGYRFVFDSEVRINRRGDSPLAIGRVAVKRNTPISAVGRYVQQRITWDRLRRAVLRAPKQFLGLRRYDKLRRCLLGEKPAPAQPFAIS